MKEMTINDIMKNLNALTNNEIEFFEGIASFGSIIKSFKQYDKKFNMAFSAGSGALFDKDGNLLGVDGFGLFKYLQYETYPILKKNENMYILKLEGSLSEDYFKISIKEKK